MTKSAVGLASDLCRTYVGPLAVVILAVLALGAPASAGAWEEFERRCLVPMENVEAPDVSKLSIDHHMSRKEYHVYFDYDLQFDMIVWFETGSDIRGCSVVRADAAAIKFALDWAELNIQNGKYVALKNKDSHSARVLQSNEWREPRLEVSIQTLGESDGPWISAMETDLES